MSKRYSERLTETFRDDELSKLNGTGINGRHGGGSKTPRQSSGKESLPMYRPTRGTANPFRCNTCGSSQLKALATLYAQGTSTAVSMKGFFFKHSYPNTWRQTEMAKLCAPPSKKALFPPLSAGHRSWWNICRVRGLSAIGRERPSDGVLLSCWLVWAVSERASRLLESPVFPSTHDRVQQGASAIGASELEFD
jgi:hypothetical protein